jgi:hypothetical protein
VLGYRVRCGRKHCGEGFGSSDLVGGGGGGDGDEMGFW